MLFFSKMRWNLKGMNFEIEFVQWLKVGNGKIVRWKSYTDPAEIIRALKGDAPAG
jgi:ketosteroid isomerase-like protein